MTLHIVATGRAKAGGKQSSRDASGKVGKSAGSALRRHNEVRADWLVTTHPWRPTRWCLNVREEGGCVVLTSQAALAMFIVVHAVHELPCKTVERKQLLGA